MKRTTNQITSFIMALVFIVYMTSGCKKEPDIQEYMREFYTMDTVITILINSDDERTANEALDIAEESFIKINTLSTRFANTPIEKEQSDVWRINEYGTEAPVEVSGEVFDMIKTSMEYADMCGGAFNIAMGGISDIWGFYSGEYRIPSDEEISRTLMGCDYRNVILNESDKTVSLLNAGTSIDLGAVAKGYATDMAVAAIKEKGIKSALINAGGNVYAIGSKPDGTKWRVGLQNPQVVSEIVGVIEAEDEAIVSSGDYQRYFIEDGVRYHHIFDPVTGYPAAKAVASTIIDKSATRADIMSTLVFVLGHEKTRELFEKEETLSRVQWLVMTESDNIVHIHGDSGIKDRISLEDGVVFAD